jgi:hypothetical protein
MVPTLESARVLQVDVGHKSCKFVFDDDFLRIVESPEGARSTTELPMRQVIWADAAQDQVTLHYLSSTRGGLQLQRLVARSGANDPRTASWIESLINSAYKGKSGGSWLPIFSS